MQIFNYDINKCLELLQNNQKQNNNAIVKMS